MFAFGYWDHRRDICQSAGKWLPVETPGSDECFTNKLGGRKAKRKQRDDRIVIVGERFRSHYRFLQQLPLVVVIGEFRYSRESQSPATRVGYVPRVSRREGN